MIIEVTIHMFEMIWKRFAGTAYSMFIPVGTHVKVNSNKMRGF